MMLRILLYVDYGGMLPILRYRIFPILETVLMSSISKIPYTDTPYLDLMTDVLEEVRTMNRWREGGAGLLRTKK